MVLHTITHNSVVKPSDKVLWNTIDDEAIVLNMNNGYYYTLNGVALAMWQACDGNRTIHEAARALIDVYDAPQAQLEQDMVAFFQDCLNESLVTIVT
jgi:hypothetical protein